MIDLIERIGPYLGIAAFLGLAVLAFLIFQQAREVRRLRQWAGRAPERADAAQEAEGTVAEARGEEPEEAEAPPELPGRLATALAAVRSRFDTFYATLDRRSPVDPRYFLVVIAAGVVAAGVLTSGFGLFGDDGDAPSEQQAGKGKGGKDEKIEVTVLNGTQDDSGSVPIEGVPGLAGDIAKEVVKPAGFAIGEKTDAPTGFDETTIMFEAGEDAAAQELAEAVAEQLGETEVEPITSDVADLAAGAPLVLIVGQDDAEALE